MALLTQTPYKARTFDLSGLTGISDNTLEVHFGLYAGYVKNTNLLNEQLVTMQAAGQGLSSNPSYAEITRRLGFEYNGMVLHEWYFGNLTKASGGGISSSSALGRALGESTHGARISPRSAACAALVGRSRTWTPRRAG